MAMQLSPFSGWVVCDIDSLLVDAVFHSPASKFVSHVLSCSCLIFPMSILGGQACPRMRARARGRRAEKGRG